MVFALIPGGVFPRGAQRLDSLAPNHARFAEVHEAPVHDVTLSPFLLSKYEVTQGQWLRVMGDNPSHHGPGMIFADHTIDLSHPVERVRWDESETFLARLDLTFVSEAQWEYAARGGTLTTWWTGDERGDLAGATNLADLTCKHNGGGEEWYYEDWEDGHYAHAPVGSFAPNPFGIYDLLGNVQEWCLDTYAPNAYEVLGECEDPAVVIEGRDFHVARGGSYDQPASQARSALRSFSAYHQRKLRRGLRAARELRGAEPEAAPGSEDGR